MPTSTYKKKSHNKSKKRNNSVSKKRSKSVSKKHKNSKRKYSNKNNNMIGGSGGTTGLVQREAEKDRQELLDGIRAILKKLEKKNYDSIIIELYWKSFCRSFPSYFTYYCRCYFS